MWYGMGDVALWLVKSDSNAEGTETTRARLFRKQEDGIAAVIAGLITDTDGNAQSCLVVWRPGCDGEAYRNGPCTPLARKGMSLRQ